MITQSSRSLSSSGTINYSPSVNVTVNPDNIVLFNTLELGVQLNWEEVIRFALPSYVLYQQRTKDANLYMMRFFDFVFEWVDPSKYWVCKYWDEQAGTGTFDWQWADALVKTIYAVGGEPLICLGQHASSVGPPLPNGMYVDPVTKLPRPTTFAKYCLAWIDHFKTEGFPVKFYEILNEPFNYFGWTPNVTKLGYYRDLWNECVRAMRAANPSVKVSFDFITRKQVLDYWLNTSNQCESVDFLDFHKYDCSQLSGPDYYTDPEPLFTRSEKYGFEDFEGFYGVAGARARVGYLPMIFSESNVNSAWQEGTDPRMVQMSGAVWRALVLRTAILKQLDHVIHFQLTGAESGAGFGLITKDTNKSWYPYYVHKMIGPNLAVGDPIIETTSSSDDVRVIGWRNQNKVNILLICKSTQPINVQVSGIGDAINYIKIDNTIPYTDANIQDGVTSPTINLFGYTVMLLQQ